MNPFNNTPATGGQPKPLILAESLNKRFGKDSLNTPISQNIETQSNPNIFGNFPENPPLISTSSFNDSLQSHLKTLKNPNCIIPPPNQNTNLIDALRRSKQMNKLNQPLPTSLPVTCMFFFLFTLII